MHLDAVTTGHPPRDVAARASRAEADGYDGWFVGETQHDPFVQAALAGSATDRLTIGTGIAVAFARSPMDVAYSAHDLTLLTGGRFVLGLGSQVRAHIVHRFGATWSRPADRMREYVAALRAIWSCWNDGTDLAFRGEFHRHVLMTPFFAPPPSPHGPPPVVLAAVGPAMTRVAGEVADGLLCHAFTTDHYLREHTLPALRDGADAAGRDPDEVTVALGAFVVTGRDPQERAQAEAHARRQIAFYGSTPAYRRVLEAHGWGDLQSALAGHARDGEWDAMADLVGDDVLAAFAVDAAPRDVGAALRDRFRGLVDRISLYTTFEPDADEVDAIRRGLAGTPAGTRPGDPQSSAIDG